MSRIDRLDVEIQQKAIKFRRENGFSNTEPIRLKSLLLKLNVLTVFRKLSGTFSGMAIKVSNDRFMMVNQDHNLGKQHFTIAHELYHLFIQENFLSKSCVTGLFNKSKNADIEEYKADMFAAFFLMPEDGITLAITPAELSKKDSIRLETILKIEQYYSVSRTAVLHRLKNMNIISSTFYDWYATNVKRSAAAYGYESDLYSPGNSDLVIGDYGVKAHSLFEKEKISESHYLELMRSIGFDPSANDDTENEQSADC